MELLVTIWIGVLGACIGSFLNVVIYRLPKGESVVHPRSHCSCGRMIPWYDNIPVLSWFILRGRCRSCGQKFSIRYALVELLTAALFVLLWWRFSPPVAVFFMLWVSAMIAASFIDLDTMEIPDRFSIGGFVAGVVASVAIPAIHGVHDDILIIQSLHGFTVSLQGAFIGSGLILWIALLAEAVLRREAMGFGDVKLMGAIGAVCGWQGAVFAIFGGAVIGSVAVIVYRICGGKKIDAIPFGPSLVTGALVYLLYLDIFVDNYFYEIAQLLFP